jgi:lanthionine-containing peptide SapB
MSVLDLQGMESTAPQNGGGGGGSSNSGHSCPSNLSVLLCNGSSGLSVAICHE